MLVISLAAFSHNITVSGTVTDSETEEAMIGVNVVIKGTIRGVVTDLNGQFTMSDCPPDAVLVFSYVGYEPLEVPVQRRTGISAKMNVLSSLLEEVVVIGYGTVAKSGVAGKVTVSYNAYYGFKKVANELATLGVEDYVHWQYEYALLADNLNNYEKFFGVYQDIDLYNGQPAINWFEQVFGHIGKTFNHDLTITGGSSSRQGQVFVPMAIPMVPAPVSSIHKTVWAAGLCCILSAFSLTPTATAYRMPGRGRGG